MRLGKRRRDADAADAPAPGADTAAQAAVTEPVPEPPAADEPYEETVVEGEAVELPAEERGAPVFEPPRPEPMPFPVAEEPVAVVTPGPEPPPVTSLGGSAEAYASGHAAAPGPSWQEPVMELANERPELVVAAAFAGGLLAALILRRLGS